jgi:hypothetical protein
LINNLITKIFSMNQTKKATNKNTGTPGGTQSGTPGQTPDGTQGPTPGGTSFQNGPQAVSKN